MDLLQRKDPATGKSILDARYTAGTEIGLVCLMKRRTTLRMNILALLRDVEMLVIDEVDVLVENNRSWGSYQGFGFEDQLVKICRFLDPRVQVGREPSTLL